MAPRITIEFLKDVAKKRKGKCLSLTYLGTFKKLIWQCEFKHSWEATPDSVKRGSWCPTCSLKINGEKRRKYSISSMRIIAKKRMGRCLSKEYSTIQDRLKWQCSEGHNWEASVTSILRGTWCPKCGLKKATVKRSGTIEEMKKIAIERKGKCLSSTYKNSNEKLKWECEVGHKWIAISNSIKRGSWCPFCADSRRYERLVKKRSTIEKMHELASSKGGKCLSEYYVNSQSKLTWECSDGHVWESSPGNISSGTWCPECNNYIGETIARNFFEHIFDKKFPKKKPRWLFSKSNTRLELDGYCEELGIAFEHQGRQHYQKSYFAKRDSDLKRITESDKDKALACKRNNVTLVIIPEIGYYTPIENLYDFLISKLKKHKISIPKHSILNHSSLDLIKSVPQIRELNAIAEEKGGTLLSTIYMGNSRKLKWQCKKKHIWEATPSKIKQGRWCHLCNTRKKFTLEVINDLAKNFNGKCLSTKYINGKSKLLWECSEGHRWEAVSISIKQGHWCPKCAQVKTTNLQRGNIEKMHILASDKGGKCLSDKYNNAKTKLKWQCSKGHIWETTSDSIQSGRWCRKCANIRNVVNLYKKKK